MAKRSTKRSTESARRSTKRSTNFTKRTVAAVKPPTGCDRVYVYDAKQPALALCVTASGGRTFYVYKRVRGRPTRIKLGRFPDELTVEQARRQTAELLGDIARGEDPQARKRALRKQATLREVFDHYIDAHVKVHCKPATQAEDQRLFDKHLGTWQARRLDNVTRSDVVALHARIGKKTPYLANRVLEVVKKLFNHARRMDIWSAPNPCEGVRRFKETSRDRFLDAGELKRLLKAIAAEDDPFPDFFCVLLLTGQRRGNVQSMRWSDIDLTRGVWRIHETETKNREPMTVVLVPTCVDILQRRCEQTKGEHVFAGNGKTGHLIEPKSAWGRIRERAKLPDLRMHDLRRTLGSWMAAAGASLPIIGRSLGHKTARATEIYARLSLDPVRESVNKATQAMLTAADGSEILNGGRGDG